VEKKDCQFRVRYQKNVKRRIWKIWWRYGEQNRAGCSSATLRGNIRNGGQIEQEQKMKMAKAAGEG